MSVVICKKDLNPEAFDVWDLLIAQAGEGFKGDAVSVTIEVDRTKTLTDILTELRAY